MAKECECGCGETVKSAGARFRRGHNRWGSGPKLEPPNPSGLCQCGCGERAPLARQSDREYGWVKGHPVRFIVGHQNRDANSIDYVVDAETGCWVWQRGTTTKGYAVTVVDQRKAGLAHRAYYKRHVGPIPEGHHLHHTCEVRACVNPEHLEPITPGEHNRLHRAAA